MEMEWQAWLRRRLVSLVRFVVIVGFALLLGKITEPLLSPPVLHHLETLQTDALDSATTFNPWSIGELYTCALMGRTRFDPIAGKQMLSQPCEVEASQSADALDISVNPAPKPKPDTVMGAMPQLGHWAEGMNGPYAWGLAFADVAYHLVKRPTVFATVLVVLEFFLGYCVTAVLAGWLLSEDDGALLLVIVPVGTVLSGCAVAWLTRQLTIWGLELFGQYLQTAGLCCSVGGLSYAAYEFSLKSFEVKMEEMFGEVLTHAWEFIGRLIR